MSHPGLDKEPLTLKFFSVGHDMEPEDFWGRSFARGVKRIRIFPGWLNYLDPDGCLVRTGIRCKPVLQKIKSLIK